MIHPVLWSTSMNRAVLIGQKQLEAYEKEGYIILRGAFSKARIKSLLEGLNRLMDAALAGRCEIGWIDKDKRLPNRISNMLHPDKYQGEFAAWLDEDLNPQ